MIVFIYDKTDKLWYESVEIKLGDCTKEFVIGKEIHTGKELMSGRGVEHLVFCSDKKIKNGNL